MNIDFRGVKKGDILNLLNLLADDELGARREDVSVPLNQSYMDALRFYESLGFQATHALCRRVMDRYIRSLNYKQL